MTKKELEQIYYLSREIKLWERELQNLKERSLVASPSLSIVHSGGTTDKIADLAEKKITLESKIQEKRDEIQKLRDNATEYILTIPDSLTRIVIYCRCVKLMSWKRVALEAGGYNTADSVRMVYNRFFDKK